MKSLLKTLAACKKAGARSLDVIGLFNPEQLKILRENGYMTKPYNKETDTSVIYW